jgi:hypothetical protein
MTIVPSRFFSVKVPVPTDSTVPVAAGGVPWLADILPPKPPKPRFMLLAVTTPEVVVPSTLTISPAVMLTKVGEVTFWSLYVVDEVTSTMTVVPSRFFSVKEPVPTDSTVPAAAGGVPWLADIPPGPGWPPRWPVKVLAALVLEALAEPLVAASATAVVLAPVMRTTARAAADLVSLDRTQRRAGA